MSYDAARGLYRVWWFDGLRRRSRIVAKLPKNTPKPKRPPAEVLRALADAEALELASRRDRPLEPGRTVGQFLASYRAWYASERAAGSLGELDQVSARLLAVASKQLVAEFGRADAVAHLDRLRASGLKGSTIRKHIGMLSGAWGRAMRREELRSNPWLNLDLPEKVEPDRPSWTPEEFDRLVAVCRPWLRTLLTVGVHTGLRIGELIALRWSWVQWGQGQRERYGSIRVPAEAAKSGRSRRIPLHETIHDLLMQRFLRDGDDGGPILRGQSGRPIRNSKHVALCLNLACKRAGLPEVGTHTMRRTFGRWAVLGVGPWKGRPVPMFVVSRWMGHADMSQTAIYLDLEEVASDDWMSGAAPPATDRP